MGVKKPYYSRRGLSLIELVLALALSVLVISLVTMAIQFQLRTFEQRRDHIDQASLGRAILRNIGDDLRCAIAYRPIDLQGVSTVTGNASQNLGTTPAAGDTQQQPGSSTTPMSSTTSPMSSTSPMSGSQPSQTNPMGSSSDTSDSAASGAPSGKGAYVAGLYGDQYSVQFDITRLPRLDEYSSLVVDNGLDAITQIPADIRTVSYYLAGSTPMTQAASAQMQQTGIDPTGNSFSASLDALAPPEAKGLVRQERDRSVASYSNVAVDFSDLSQDTGEEMLAEEVTRLEFQYYDGYQWWPNWDSDDRGGLPVAIEIIVGLTDRKVDEEAEPVNPLTTDATGIPQELIYRLVVRIPTAEPLDPYALEEEEATMPTDSGEDTAAADANAATNSQGAANSNSAATPMGAGATPMFQGRAAPLDLRQGGQRGGGDQGGGRGQRGGDSGGNRGQRGNDPSQSGGQRGGRGGRGGGS